MVSTTTCWSCSTHRHASRTPDIDSSDNGRRQQRRQQNDDNNNDNDNGSSDCSDCSHVNQPLRRTSTKPLSLSTSTTAPPTVLVLNTSTSLMEAAPPKARVSQLTSDTLLTSMTPSSVERTSPDVPPPSRLGLHSTAQQRAREEESQSAKDNAIPRGAVGYSDATTHRCCASR
jgi:hypothetical protein